MGINVRGIVHDTISALIQKGAVQDLEIILSTSLKNGNPHDVLQHIIITAIHERKLQHLLEKLPSLELGVVRNIKLLQNTLSIDTYNTLVKGVGMLSSIESNDVRLFVSEAKEALAIGGFTYGDVVTLIADRASDELKSDSRILSFIRFRNFDDIRPGPIPFPPDIGNDCDPFKNFVKNHARCLEDANIFQTCIEIFCSSPEQDCIGKMLPTYDEFVEQF